MSPGPPAGRKLSRAACSGRNPRPRPVGAGSNHGGRRLAVLAFPRRERRAAPRGPSANVPADNRNNRTVSSHFHPIMSS